MGTGSRRGEGQDIETELMELDASEFDELLETVGSLDTVDQGEDEEDTLGPDALRIPMPAETRAAPDVSKARAVAFERGNKIPGAETEVSPGGPPVARSLPKKVVPPPKAKSGQGLGHAMVSPDSLNFEDRTEHAGPVKVRSSAPPKSSAAPSPKAPSVTGSVAPPKAPSVTGSAAPPEPPSPPPSVKAPRPRQASVMQQPGAQFGRFRLLARAGVVRDSELWLANDGPGSSRPVVIKRQNPDVDQDERLRFSEAARVGRLLAHPNVIAQHDAGEVGGQLYVALEFVDGLDLEQLCTLASPGRLPLSVSVEIAMHVSDALAYAHALRGENGAPLDLIHRDITPTNILIGRSGEVKLTDFGLARFEGREVETVVGPPRGTLPYMAPEQVKNRRLDQRTDLFALGTVLAELVTGEKLFVDGVLACDEPAGLVHERCQATGLPDALRALLVQLTAAPPEGRPDSAVIVTERLQQVLATLSGETSLSAYLRHTILGRLPKVGAVAFEHLVQDVRQRVSAEPNPRRRRNLRTSALPTVEAVEDEAVDPEPATQRATDALQERPLLAGAVVGSVGVGVHPTTMSILLTDIAGSDSIIDLVDVVGDPPQSLALQAYEDPDQAGGFNADWQEGHAIGAPVRNESFLKNVQSCLHGIWNEEY